MAGERILVLDADSVAGLAVVQSLGAAGYQCVLGATSDAAPAFASRWARSAVLYPDPLHDLTAFNEWLRAWVRAHPVDLIIPATECTLVPLHGLRDDAEIARRAAIPSARTLDLALDKERLRVLAAELGVVSPPSLYVTAPAELRDARIDEWLRDGSVVVKTSRSKQWNGARAHEYPAVVVADRATLDREAGVRVAHVAVQVQKWVPGRGFGVEVLAHRGEIVMSLAHERLHEVPLNGGGSSYRRTVAMPADLYEDARKLMRALECDGVAMVEFRVDQATGQHWLMEINMRFWGSLPLAIFAGADFPRALVELTLEGRIPDGAPPRAGRYGRNLSREVKWLKLMLKARRGASAGASLLQWGRLLVGRERLDGASVADAGPFVRELRSVVGKELAGVVDQARRSVTLRRAARLSRRRARHFAQVERVLVLCYGNICRSPYVEKRLVADGRAEVRSSGFYPVVGRTTPDDVQRVALRRGVDLAAHRSRRVTREDLEWAELVLIMDRRNHEHLRELDAASLGKTIWLGALDGGGIEIDDPYETSDAEIDRVLARIDACVEKLLTAA